MVKNLGAETYQGSLYGMLDAFFRDVADNGFWSEAEGRIVRALKFKSVGQGELEWSPDMDERFRYGPMALMGVAMWRLSQLGDDRYDDKLVRNLRYFRDLLTQPDVVARVPSYGAGPLIYALGRLHEIWPDEGFYASAESLGNLALDRYKFKFNEDSLVLMGLAALGDQLTGEQQAKMRKASESLLALQDSKGLFRNPDHNTSFKHQNQMYTIWGLGHCDRVLGETRSVESLRRCLQYTIDNRMTSDGALLWHHYRNWLHRAHSTTMSFVGRVPEPIRLYSCHQAFFVYAVQVYQQLTKDPKAFADARDLALQWLYGQNVAGVDLFDRSGIGIPMRIMLLSGEMDVATQRFVGIYEIGAMIMCMVCLLEESNTAMAS